MAQVTKIQMTADEFRQLPETMQITQLINGELIVAPSPVSKHQKLVGRVFSFLDDLVPNGDVMVSPMDVYLDEINAFQPDVFWVAEDSTCQERDGYFYGAPDLVVEILSPSTAKYDKGKKFDSYKEHGVREYWMVDPISDLVEVWQRNENQFKRLGVFGEGDSFTSTTLQAPIPVSKLFKR